MAEVAGVLRGIGVRRNRIAVLSCDAAVGVVQQVTRAEELELLGGGGTDMRVGIETALAQPQRPDVIVVLTDGVTPWPEAPVAARVIAGLIGADPPSPPDWIECIHITN
jgi:predicted metal-dependent peptidase